jgi:hypothetical protein
MHKLDDRTLLTPVLLQRFRLEGEYEGGDGRYYALMLRSDGNLLSHHPGAPMLDPMQSMWAADVLKLFNRELHHDGAWVVCFTHLPPINKDAAIVPKHAEYHRYCLIWLDADGDPQFTMDWANGETELLDFADVMLAGIVSTGMKAEASWQVWHQKMRKLIDPKEGQTFKRAKGETAASLRR